MPITVRCRCGQAFAARDDLAGTTVACPSCGSALTIPGPQPTSGARLASTKKRSPATRPASQPRSIGDLLDEEGIYAPKTDVFCPNCKADMNPGALICVRCGYDVERERCLTTKVEIGTSEEEVEPAPAVKRRRRPLANVDFGSILGYAALGALCLIIVVGLFNAVAAGALLFFTGLVMSTFGTVWLLVVAFRDHVAHGVLCLLCNLYMLLYALMNWEECQTPFLVQIGGSFISMIGVGIVVATIGPQ